MKIIVIVDKHSDGTMTVDIRDKSKVAAYFMKYPEGRHFLEFEDVQEPEECKSWEQCKYYWGVLVKEFSKFLESQEYSLPIDKKERKEEVSDILKFHIKFIKPHKRTKANVKNEKIKILSPKKKNIVVINGVEMEAKSISKIGKEPMSLLIQSCYNFLNVEVGLNIESSQDYYDRLRHEQEQRNKFINIIKTN